MSDSNQTPKKLQHHVAYLCRLAGRIIFLYFIIGCSVTILSQSTDNFLNWRINFALQLFERSHLPLISLALYALSITGNEERKHHASIYWKRLTIFSVLGILLYLGALANSSYRLYSLMPSGYHPIVSYEEDLKKMTSIVGAMSSVDEANKALENTFKRSGKKNSTQANESLEAIKKRIIEEEEKLLLDHHEKQKKQYLQRQRSMRFESIRYVLYSFIFIIFYFNLTLFFNRLHKSS
jgi:hypothetical protein